MITQDLLNRHWPRVALGEVVEFLDHQRRPVTASERSPGPYPYYGANGQQDSVADYIFDESLVLLAEDGGYFGDPEKTVAYRIAGKCWVNNHAHVLRPTGKINIGFLCRHLERYDLRPFISGTTRQKLTKGQAEKIPIVLPPLFEQKRIADILDRADAIRRKRHQASAEVQEFIRGFFLTESGDPQSNARQFATLPLAEVASVNRGKFTPRPRNDPRYYGGTYPFIQTGDISASGGILRRWKQTLNEDGKAVSRSFPAGTVVIAIVGATIGETAILEREMYCPDSVVGIRPKPNVATPEFIEFLLRFFKQAFRDMAPETARANINLENLRPLMIPVPPLERQQEFSRVCTIANRLTAKMSAPSTGVDELFNALVQKAFRGEI